ncbi:MAG TPA: 23S rRNA (adenine(2503)-C(2))-methyltransferase RlmN [Phycisphaerales bacterium]|nr:23S rRNA (adenine(2503)-C(2))-methyltransferase RlmN [Phycisphaerales bacterium]
MTCTPDIPSPLSVDSARYASACLAAQAKGGHAGAIDRYRAFYRQNAVPGGVALRSLGRIHESESSEGIVRKFTLTLGPTREGVYDKSKPGERLETESVIIPMIGKRRIRTHTLCVSSQVGCAMGCQFCQTAQMGLVRNLTAQEIVGQWYAARWMVGRYQDTHHREHREHRENDEENPASALSLSVPLVVTASGCPSIRNVVFMGMGEPMDNLSEVIAAIAILTDRNGPNLPMSKVTISTVGRVDGIAQLADQVRKPGWHRLNLAVSLNAPNDDIRAAIMPINRRFGMSQLREALETWPIYGAAKLCLEYVLIPGVNDAKQHAEQLGDYVLGRAQYAGRPPLPGLVNLIPYNPREGSPWPAPEEPSVDQFLAWLSDTGVYAKRRRTKGRDQMAACGQLGNLEFRRKRLQPQGLTIAASMP